MAFSMKPFLIGKKHSIYSSKSISAEVLLSTSCLFQQFPESKTANKRFSDDGAFLSLAARYRETI